MDMVNNPAHYNKGQYETIDIIVDTLGIEGAIAYCRGNVLKYTIRMMHKNAPLTDARKAQWYLNKTIELMGALKSNDITWALKQ